MISYFQLYLNNFYGYKRVPKAWGEEIWLCNSPLYCAKLLRVAQGMRCSMHSHPVKSETFFVLAGSPLVEENFQDRELAQGDSMHVSAGTWHRFSAPHGDVVLLEVSTLHSDEDVKRLEESGPIPAKQ